MSPLTTVKSNSGKLPLILDLRYVNKHVHKDKTKFGDGKTMEEYLAKEDYHHIDINENHQKFLSFAWAFEEKKYNVLLFGLPSAPFIFKLCDV